MVAVSLLEAWSVAGASLVEVVEVLEVRGLVPLSLASLGVAATLAVVEASLVVVLLVGAVVVAVADLGVQILAEECTSLVVVAVPSSSLASRLHRPSCHIGSRNCKAFQLGSRCLPMRLHASRH